MIAEPSSNGGAKVTDADWAPAVADTEVGASGTVAGVTAADAGESGPGPMPLVARTVKVYLSPSVKPVTVSGPTDPDAVWPPLAGVVRSVAVTV